MTPSGRFPLLKTFQTLLLKVFGRWHWDAPEWTSTARHGLATAWRWLASDRRRMAAFILAICGLIAGSVWLKLRPKPHYVEYTVAAPALTEYTDKGISAIHPLQIQFTEPAAPLAKLDKRLTSGIEISPTVAGTWVWLNDKQLRFSPRDDWPVDTTFTVRISRRNFLAKGVELEDYSFPFKTQPFSAKISESRFYQDPQNPNLKKLVATVAFSHPVDSAQFEQRVSLSAAKDAAYLGLHEDSRNFTVVYDKFRLFAHIHSAALGMPRDDTSMTVHVDKGVRAARGGNETKDKLEATVTIPGRTSLRFSGAQMTLVENARYEPEQVLLVNSSSPVAENALSGKVSAWLLPVHHPNPSQPQDPKQPYRWEDESQIGTDVLAKAEPLPLNYVASDGGGNTTHGFKFHAPVGRYLYLLVKEDVQGTGGYISAHRYAATVQVEPYPPALTFLGHGALLSLGGDKKAGYLTRDVDMVEVEVGRVLPNQLQHLAPQMWDYSKPQLGDLENSIVERFTVKRDYRGKAPGKPTYDSIDLGQYLQDRSASRRGLFLLHIRSVKPDAYAPDNNADNTASDTGDDTVDSDGSQPDLPNRPIQDTRLILVTDLGFIVKQAADGSREVFVQSIHGGDPVSGARVEVLGRNGQPVMAATTDAAGRAHLAKLPDLRREKSPLIIVVEKESDFSFMPLRIGDRTLDFSRFDIGGVVNARSAQQLSAYLFTDRGIYRPGETAHLGMVTRTADWKTSPSGLPVVVEISDSRGAVVSRDTVKLADSGFDEVTFTTQTASPTGTYQAVAWLMKDEKQKEMLGSTSFRVQEFEPDRMKVRLDLSDKPIPGWLRPSELKAHVSVAFLFGEPAANRRVESEITLTPTLPHFSRYEDYRFSIGEALNEPFHESLTPTVTDDKGATDLKIDLGRFVGRAYRINVLARAFEAEGGRNVAAQNSAVIADAPYLVGVKPDGDMSFVRRASARHARWLAINQQLTPVAADQLTLDWVQRTYVSVLTQQPDQTYKYVSRLKEVVRNTRAVSIASGGSDFPLPTQEPGDFVLVLRNAAGAELNRIAYSVAGEANISRSLERNAELQIQLDKSAYAGGDTMEVSIRAPYTGAGLITVERERVFQHQWFRTTTTSSVQRVTLPRDFEGNGYVSVQFLRDPSSDEIFMSPLSYGVAPFSGSVAARTQQVRLTAPREIKPGATLTMRVAPAEASRVAVLAVDEGILQVARYKNPDPLSYFFQKRMLQVETSQILDLILPEFRRFIALAAPGGDADGGYSRHLNPFNRKRKDPVAWWSGLIDAGPAGRELRYTVPDYFNGKLRIVAIAVNARKVGVAEADTEVKGDFILTPNVPAMVAPGDEFSVTVGVFNNSSAPGADPVHVDAQVSRELTPLGPSRSDLPIASKKEGVAEFRFRANALLGSASLKFIASRGKLEAREEESVSVRPAVAYRTQLTLGQFDAANATVPLTRNMYSEKRSVQAAVSSVPLVWGDGLTAFLDAYPYLCTEQLVSKLFAALLLASRPEFGAVRTKDAQPIAGTLSMLQSRANDQGGFGLWSSSPETAEFPTLYAAQFLIEARDRGQKVPPTLQSGVNDWMTRFASTPASTLTDARLRAYAVYLLARQGIKPNSALANVEQELSNRYAQTWPTDIAAAYLASTYRLMQRNNDANRIVAKVPWSQQKRDWELDGYYDPSIHDADLIYLTARHFPERMGSIPKSALEGIAATINGNRETSLSASATLLALDAYAKSAASKVKFGISSIGSDGREQPLALTAGAMPKAAVPEGSAKVRFNKDGPAPAYYSLNESGFDRNPPATDVSQGLDIIHEFLDAKGNPLTRVNVGQEFLVRIRLRSVKLDRVSQVAVVDLLPGGMEPVIELQPPADTANAAIDPAAVAGRQAGVSALPIGIAAQSNWVPQHIDVRDDRIVFYGDVTRDAATFVYRVRATNAGTFQTPPAFAEAMYNRSVNGRGLAGKLEVVKP
jgi:uncharacterized protein YfaS (alpha-2-macroglobulin family)